MARQTCGDGKCGELRGWNSPGFTGHAVRKDPESAEIAMILRGVPEHRTGGTMVKLYFRYQM